MFEWLASPEAWMALGTLIALEVVLGVDNIIFISILAGKLPEHQRATARQVGIAVPRSVGWACSSPSPGSSR
jgi:predicted tellurium resistance membrane protein TerC